MDGILGLLVGRQVVLAAKHCKLFVKYGSVVRILSLLGCDCILLVEKIGLDNNLLFRFTHAIVGFIWMDGEIEFMK